MRDYMYERFENNIYEFLRGSLVTHNKTAVDAVLPHQRKENPYVGYVSNYRGF